MPRGISASMDLERPGRQAVFPCVHHELQHRFESTLNSIIYPACMLDPHRGPATHVHATRTCTRPRSRKSDLRETGTKHEKHRPT